MNVAPKIEEVLNGVYRIRIDVPFGVESVSIYLLDFPPLMLVDSGPRMPGLFGAIQDAIRSAGFDPREIDSLLITHGHVDHHGLASRFREMGIKVMIHREDLNRLSHNSSFIKAEFFYYAELLSSFGIPAEFTSRFSKVAKWFEGLALPCSCDRVLEGTEKIEGENLSARLIHCPGHSAGHVMLELTNLGALITGDHLLPDITPNPELYYPPRNSMLSGLTDYVESLKSMESIDAELAFPAHGEPFLNPGERAREVIEHHRERANKVLEVGRSGAKGLWEITLELFEEEIKRGELELFLALKEVLGHLEMLKNMGRLEGFEFPSHLPVR